MDRQRPLSFCLCFLSAIVSLRAQAECDMIQASDLGSSTPSTDGIIALLLGSLDAASRPMVSVSNVEVISLAVGTVQNMFRWASVFATYNCSGMLCPTVPYPTTEQFEAQCVEPTPGNPIWTDPNLLFEDRSTPINPNLTSLDLRKDCSFCLSPDDRGNLGVPAAIAIDAEFHCAACAASCLTGSDGLGYCTGVTAGDCCNVYQPNAMGVNICALSCDMGHEADSPDFICERRCPVLSAPTNGQVSHPTRTVGSVATYTCGLFDIASGDAMRTCQSNSTWDGTAAVCSDLQQIEVAIEKPEYLVREDLSSGKHLALQVCAVVQQPYTDPFYALISTSDITTDENFDYQPLMLELHFDPSGSPRQCGCIHIIDDSIDEENESFSVHINSTTLSVELIGTTAANVTILDDDDGASCVPILSFPGSLTENILVRPDKCENQLEL